MDKSGTVVESGSTHSGNAIKVVEPTCADRGYTIYKCSKCGVMYKSDFVPATGIHSYKKSTVAPTCTEDGYDKLICNVCGDEQKINIVGARGHDFVQNKVVEPTCTAQGYTLDKCSRCSETQKRDYVDSLGHDYAESVVPATCGKDGYTLHKCSVCNSEYKDNYVDALGHNWVSGTIIKKASFTEDGAISGSECSRCHIKNGSETAIAKVSKVTPVHYVYSGTYKKPNVELYDSNGKLISSDNYTISPATTKKSVGKYAITVKFKSTSSKYTGSKSTYFYIDPKAPSPSVKLYTYNRVKVSWGSVTGATGYKVMYKKNTSSTWSTLKSYTTNKYYTTASGKLSSGVKYDFKVIAIKKNSSGTITNTSDDSAVKSITTLKKMAAPTVKKYSSKKVKVGWAKVTGATGYQISKSTKKTGTSIVATVTKQTTVSKTITAKKKKNYYYKVRAYKTVGTKKIYAPWSTVKAYKLK